MKELFQRLVPENGFVIGETACGHDGDIAKLKKLIDCIADSKAEIIKFQIYLSSGFVSIKSTVLLYNIFLQLYVLNQ